MQMIKTIRDFFRRYAGTREWGVIASIVAVLCNTKMLHDIGTGIAKRGYEYILRVVSRNKYFSRTLQSIAKIQNWKKGILKWREPHCTWKSICEQFIVGRKETFLLYNAVYLLWTVFSSAMQKQKEILLDSFVRTPRVHEERAWRAEPSVRNSKESIFFRVLERQSSMQRNC